MADIRDNLFGTMAIRGHFILPDQLVEALRLQRQYEEGGQQVPRLGEILASQGYMTPEQVRAVLQGQGASPKGLFGEVAIQWNLCRQTELDECLAYQRQLREQQQAPPQIGALMVARGYLRPHQVQAVLQAQGKQLVQCPVCKVRYNADSVIPGTPLICPSCNATFEIPRQQGLGTPASARNVNDIRAAGALSAPAVREYTDIGTAAFPPVGMNTPGSGITAQMSAVTTQSTAAVGGGDSASTGAFSMPNIAVGPYRLQSRLGQDHSGVLYKAVHPEAGTAVALRLFSSSIIQGAEEFDEWVSAGQAASELDHPNLQRVLFMGSEGGRAFLVTEFIEGQSLRQRLQATKTVPLAETLEVLIQCGEALQYAHSRDFIHGDLRPSDVLVGMDGVVRVGGIGIPKKVMQDLRLMSKKTGTVPLYAAPEVVIREDDADERSDLYALAACAYHMLTGEAPQEGRDVLQAGFRHALQEVRRPRAINPDLPPYVDRLLLKALCSDPEDRYDSASAFLADVRKCRAAFHAGEPDVRDVAPDFAEGQRRPARRYNLSARSQHGSRTHKVRPVGPRSSRRGRKSVGKSNARLNSIPTNTPPPNNNGGVLLSQEDIARQMGYAAPAPVDTSPAPVEMAPPPVDPNAPMEPEALEATPEDTQPLQPVLTPTGTPAVQIRGKKSNLRKSGANSGKKPAVEGKSMPTWAVVLLCVGGLGIIVGVLVWSQNQHHQDNINVPVENVVDQQEREKLNRTAEQKKELDERLATEYKNTVELYQKTNPDDLEGLIYRIDGFLAQEGKSNATHDVIKKAQALRVSSAQAGVQKSLPELLEKLKTLIGEQQFVKAGEAVKEWRKRWGEDAAKVNGDAQATRVTEVEKKAAEMNFAKIAQDIKDKKWDDARSITAIMSDKYSFAYGDKARSQKMDIDRLEREAKSGADADAERKRRESLAAARETNAPLRFNKMLDYLKDPLSHLDLPAAQSVIDGTAEELTGTAKGADFQQLKTDMAKLQELRDRIASAARDGKMKELRVKFQENEYTMIDATAKGPVLDVKGGRSEIEWQSVPTPMVLDMARRASNAASAEEMFPIGLMQLYAGLLDDAEKTLNGVNRLGFNPSYHLKQIEVRRGPTSAPKDPKDLGWEISKGTWGLQIDGSFKGDRDKELPLMSMKRLIGPIKKQVAVELRGDCDMAGFSFGKGKRFLVKPTADWTTLSLETGVDGKVRMYFNGRMMPLLKPEADLALFQLGGEVYLRGEGNKIEFRRMTIDGAPPVAPGAAPAPTTPENKTAVLGNEEDKNAPKDPEEARPATQSPDEVKALKAEGWLIAQGIWQYQPNPIKGASLIGFPDGKSLDESEGIKRPHERTAQKITVEVRGRAAAAGIGFGEGKRFLMPLGGTQWQKLEIDLGGTPILMKVNGEPRASLEDTSKAKPDDLGKDLFLQATGGKVEFRNFKSE